MAQATGGFLIAATNHYYSHHTGSRSFLSTGCTRSSSPSASWLVGNLLTMVRTTYTERVTHSVL